MSSDLGVKNDYIFEISDAILPIHYTASMGLTIKGHL